MCHYRDLFRVVRIVTKTYSYYTSNMTSDANETGSTYR